jgi:hypothetical protein
MNTKSEYKKMNTHTLLKSEYKKMNTHTLFKNEYT